MSVGLRVGGRTVRPEFLRPHLTSGNGRAAQRGFVYKFISLPYIFPFLSVVLIHRQGMLIPRLRKFATH
jgi:hypothetical protein